MQQMLARRRTGAAGRYAASGTISHRLAFHAYNSPVGRAPNSCAPSWFRLGYRQRRAMSCRVIFRLILFFMAGAVLYIIAGLGTDDLVLLPQVRPQV